MRTYYCALILLFHLVLIFAHESPSYKYSAEANTKVNINSKAIWTDTIGSILLISLAPLILLYFIPNLNEKTGLLKILLGFAAGGLLGDAFLHLIPHALSQSSSTKGHKEEHHHSHLHSDHGHSHNSHGHSHGMDNQQIFVGCWILFGIITFLFVEKLVHLIKNDDDHGHSHEKSGKNAKNVKKTELKSGDQIGFKVSGYLNLAADFTHNFTDGLAIGTSYLVDRNVGLITTLVVLIHELPHEIGDYAILVQAGCSSRKAMLLQLVTAIGALAGASISLMAAGIGPNLVSGFFNNVELTKKSIEAVNSRILPFTAGGFIYIALVTVLPVLLKKSKSNHGILQSLAEIIALLMGVGMMVLVSFYE